MSQDDSNSPPKEPLRPTVHRIEEPADPFAAFRPPTPAPPDPASPLTPRFPRLPLVLFVLTIFSTWYSGMMSFSPRNSQGEVLHYAVSEGLQYSVLILAILGAHEMGHYLQARRWHVPATLPLFIPMPFGPIGTMGAVIFQRPGVAGRRAMFDIAISGPLAGLVVAIPVLCWGIAHSSVSTLPESIPDNHMIPIFSDPLLIRGIARLIHGPIYADQELGSNPFVMAGWVGIFITALNLFPLGQLDGGHILYTLMGARAHVFARALFRILVLSMFVFGLFVDSSAFVWMLMLFLVWRMGVEHPPTSDDTEPIGSVRKVVGWATLGFLFLGFVPRPMYGLENAELQKRREAAAVERAAEQSNGQELRLKNVIP